jgi:hypothetical protein
VNRFVAVLVSAVLGVGCLVSASSASVVAEVSLTVTKSTGDWLEGGPSTVTVKASGGEVTSVRGELFRERPLPHETKPVTFEKKSSSEWTTTVTLPPAVTSDSLYRLRVFALDSHGTQVADSQTFLGQCRASRLLDVKLSADEVDYDSAPVKITGRLESRLTTSDPWVNEKGATVSVAGATETTTAADGSFALETRTFQKAMRVVAGSETGLCTRETSLPLKINAQQTEIQITKRTPDQPVEQGATVTFSGKVVRHTADGLKPVRGGLVVDSSAMYPTGDRAEVASDGTFSIRAAAYPVGHYLRWDGNVKLSYSPDNEAITASTLNAGPIKLKPRKSTISWTAPKSFPLGTAPKVSGKVVLGDYVEQKAKALGTPIPMIYDAVEIQDGSGKVLVTTSLFLFEKDPAFEVAVPGITKSGKWRAVVKPQVYGIQSATPYQNFTVDTRAATTLKLSGKKQGKNLTFSGELRVGNKAAGGRSVRLYFQEAGAHTRQLKATRKTGSLGRFSATVPANGLNGSWTAEYAGGKTDRPSKASIKLDLRGLARFAPVTHKNNKIKTRLCKKVSGPCKPLAGMKVALYAKGADGKAKLIATLKTDRNGWLNATRAGQFQLKFTGNRYYKPLTSVWFR